MGHSFGFEMFIGLSLSQRCLSAATNSLRFLKRRSSLSVLLASELHLRWWKWTVSLQLLPALRGSTKSPTFKIVQRSSTQQDNSLLNIGEHDMLISPWLPPNFRFLSFASIMSFAPWCYPLRRSRLSGLLPAIDTANRWPSGSTSCCFRLGRLLRSGSKQRDRNKDLAPRCQTRPTQEGRTLCHGLGQDRSLWSSCRKGALHTGGCSHHHTTHLLPCGSNRTRNFRKNYRNYRQRNLSCASCRLQSALASSDARWGFWSWNKHPQPLGTFSKTD